MELDMVPITKEYDAKLDSKNRLTIRGAKTDFYHVVQREDGTIELSPRELVHPDKISEKTIKMIDLAIAKFKKGEVSGPIDLDEIEKLLDK